MENGRSSAFRSGGRFCSAEYETMYIGSVYTDSIITKEIAVSFHILL